MDILIIILIILALGGWGGNFVFHYTDSQWIHLLLVVCIVVVIVRLLQGRRIL